MTKLALDALGVSKMASGHLCLNLSERVDWEAFPAFADAMISTIGGKVTEQDDAPDMRLWKVRVGDATASLVFDDYPMMVSLEASDAAGDSLVTTIHEKLSRP